MILEKRRRQEFIDLGLKNLGSVYWNLSTPSLYEEIVRRREGVISHLGPIVVRTGQRTGRSPNDKFMVDEPSSKDDLWWGDVNKDMSEKKFDLLFHRMLAYVQGRDVFVQDCFAGADQTFRVPIRVITDTAWQSLFSRNLFVQAKTRQDVEAHRPEFTMLAAPMFHAVPELDGTHSEAFIIMHLGKKLILIGGSAYGGEIKKAIFTLMNYLLPKKSVLSMHCSANVGKDGDAAIFFGLSGTGKTTLSADTERRLVGDDEHGWSDNGLFNFEGGCYAKVIRLSSEAEPEIYECTRKFGTILENVGINSETRRIDLDDAALTENTRAGYPISHIPSAIREGICGHPKNVIMLTCDAFGIMPPIARLTPAQAEYHFLSGYTAKVAGTETGIDEAQATFSTCFGAPFMALEPHVYADLLRKKVLENDVKCWLLNTGWAGEPASRADRISIKYSRALVKAVLTGVLDNVEFRTDPLFNFKVPITCSGIPSEVLDPRNQAVDKADYDARAQSLLEKFKENFVQFESNVPDDVKNVL